MMAEKARLFGDAETREKILRTPYLEQAKRTGTLVNPFIALQQLHGYNFFNKL